MLIKNDFKNFFSKNQTKKIGKNWKMSDSRECVTVYLFQNKVEKLNTYLGKYFLCVNTKRTSFLEQVGLNFFRMRGTNCYFKFVLHGTR